MRTPLTRSVRSGRAPLLVGVVLLALASVSACGSGASSASGGSSYPSRTITLIAPYAAGSPTDVMARRLASGMEKALGHGARIVVEDKPGATGAVGIAAGLSAPADGYTIVLTSTTSLEFQPLLHTKLPWRTSKDVTALGQVLNLTEFMYARKGAPFDSVQSMVAYAKAHPNGVATGAAGIGGPGDTDVRLMEQQDGISMKLVTFPNGDADGVSKLVGGQLDMYIAPQSVAGQFVKTGQLVPIAYLGSSRHPDFKDVPTMDELGYKNWLVGNQYFFIGPKGMPSGVVSKLNDAIKSAAQDPSFVKTETDAGYESAYKSASDLQKYLATQDGVYSTYLNQLKLPVGP